MVGSGVPDEVPFDVTREGMLKEARQKQRDLFQRLGERLGIAQIGQASPSARLSTGGSIAEAKAIAQDTNVFDKPSDQVFNKPKIPGVKVR